MNTLPRIGFSGSLSLLLAGLLAAAVTSGCKQEKTGSSDPHAGHTMPSAAPHAGHATPSGDPHAGHTMPQADPHAGHTMPGTASAASAGSAPAGSYRMTVEPVGELAAGKPVELKVRLLDSAGKLVEKLQVVHEKQLHFLIVSRDLAFFAHEHPEPRPGGERGVRFSFPRPGEYALFGDFTPEGGTQVVTPVRLVVPGTSTMTEPKLVADDLAKTKKFGAFEVKLERTTSGAETTLTFSILKGGQPVADLKPYLGALGHAVILDEKASTLLHSHPTDVGEKGKVRFHTSFPAAGRYKLWGEFRPEGQPLVADFVLDATKGGNSGETHQHAPGKGH